MRTLRQASPLGGLILTAAVAAGLGVTFWVLRSPPPTSCTDRATAAAIDAYRAFAIPLHLLALAALAAVVVRMSELRTGGRLGAPTLRALLAAGTGAAVCLVYHPLFGFVALPGLVGMILIGPVTVLATVAAAGYALASRRPTRPGPNTVAAIAWTGIALLVPGHLALVLIQGEPLFCF
jgi:hypothetical protein